jgi:hypothetical protein
MKIFMFIRVYSWFRPFLNNLLKYDLNTFSVFHLQAAASNKTQEFQ